MYGPTLTEGKGHDIEANEFRSLSQSDAYVLSSILAEIRYDIAELQKLYSEQLSRR